jgi:hypothetical protein
MRWLLLLGVLLALRVPSLVQPAGGDQGLYVYAGQRWLAGDVPYRDTWDQKPPGIALVYAALSWVWPHQSVVSAADLVAAACVAGLLVLLGRRVYSEGVGVAAAGLVLLFGDPSFSRLSGVYVRGQCEPFVALAVTAALVLLAAPDRRRWHLVLAGVSLAAAVWLKYNAAAYLLPVAIALWAWKRDRNASLSASARELPWLLIGIAIPTVALLTYFALHHALHDLWLATIVYNVRYSNETYDSPASVISYLVTLPIDRGRVDMLWFLAGVGVLLSLQSIRRDRSVLVVLGWLVAAVVSIAINGQRDLPNYFVQANPALALAAAVGIAGALVGGGWKRLAVGIALAAGLWRVGAEQPIGGFRWGGLPGLFENLTFDLAYARGKVDRPTYLGRFKGVKFDALEIATVSEYIRAATQPTDPIYVFGFLGGSINWQSERVSASRFFWSRPVIIEFAAGTPGYGSQGLLADLQRHPPAIVALQDEQWGSEAFFLSHDRLAGWLHEHYVLDRETAMFAIWRRRP